jgi:Tfp pilus assembly ATPase PilU
MINTLMPNYPIRDALLQIMIDNKGSDLYHTVNVYPAIKVSGEITLISEGVEKVTKEDAENFAKSLITQEQYDKLMHEKNLDFSFGINNSRFR